MKDSQTPNKNNDGNDSFELHYSTSGSEKSLNKSKSSLKVSESGMLDAVQDMDDAKKLTGDHGHDNKRDKLEDDLYLSTSSEENENEIEQMDDSLNHERDSLLVNKSSSPLHLSSQSSSSQKSAKKVLRAKRMGDGDYKDALEVIGYLDEDNFLVKMKDPKEPALCNRMEAKKNLPQLVIKYYESVINWTEDED